MGTQKIVVKVGLARKAVKEFQEEVNALLDQGYVVQDWKYEKKGLRLILFVLLDKSNPDA